jgi:ABC-type transport system involved in multi-copper enzyme maturation permease subunit
MIREVARKEAVSQRALFAITLVLMLLLTAIIPFFFDISLKRAVLNASSDTAQAVLQNFRSYPVYIESQWLARNFSRLLCLLAVLAGAGAIAGEREDRTLALLSRSSVPLSTIALIKFVFIAVWLGIVAASSTGVLAALSLGETHPYSVTAIAVASVVAWTNAMAFLGVVFAASAVVDRTAIAGALAVATGFLIALGLRPLGLNGTALASNIFGVDGSIVWRNAGIDVLVAAAICGAGLLVAVIEIERRKAY